MGISESDELRAFEATGIYRLAESGAAFLDPVRILNASYRRFRLVPSAYYSRSFGTSRQGGEAETERTGEASPERKKRKRKRQRQPKPRELNEVERMAEARHQVRQMRCWIILVLFFTFCSPWNLFREQKNAFCFVH
jgi:hypothetical protein